MKKFIYGKEETEQKTIFGIKLSPGTYQRITGWSPVQISYCGAFHYDSYGAWFFFFLFAYMIFTH